MVARIGLETDATELTLSAGETATLAFTLSNEGHVVDAFILTVSALDPGWYSLTPTEVSLFPQTQGKATLILHPPPGAALAGDYPFEVMATSRDNPDEKTTLTVRLRLAAVSELALDIEPQRIVARQGTFALRLTNAGNTARQLVLRPTDPDEMLIFAFGEAQATPIGAATTPRKTTPDAPTEEYDVSTGRPVGDVQPMASTLQADWTAPADDGGQGRLELTVPVATVVEISLTVKTKKRIWTGREQSLRFDVAATPPGVEWEAREARRVTGELVYTPYLARWLALPLMLRRALAIGIPLLMMALLLYLLLRPDPTQAGGTPTPTVAQATQTAVVAATATAGGDVSGTGGDNGGGSGSGTPGAGDGSGGEGGAGQLKILKFDWVAGADDTVQVTWEVTGATRITLNDQQVPATGTQTVDTSTDQSLTLSATNAKGDVVSQSKGVLIMRPPEIKSFTSEPAQTCPGCQVTLNWSTVRAEKVLLDGNPVQGPDGTIQVAPGQTAVFLLTAESALGKVEMPLTVTVVEGLATPTP